MNTAIKFENISKQYRLGLVSTRTLSHDLNRWWQTTVLRKEDPYLMIGESNDRSKKGESEYVWALKDITFDVKQGEVLGIIGKNGAGKSTLLKILSRVTTPTTGTIKARGRIASLLEVGTGFHPELTGRENIYMNGSIMGMTRAEITRKLDEIVEFAGVARYIDTPAKRYSSGMTVRLGFSIAAHLEPEILVVDEVLAVGDAEFQKKAIGKMQDVSQGEGRTVLFVSHNMTAVKNLCNTGIILKDGMVHYRGSILDVVADYQNSVRMNNCFNYLDKNVSPRGNNYIKVLEFNIKPMEGDLISVNSGVVFELIFQNFKEGTNIGTTFELRTIDEVIVFHQGIRASGGMNVSKKGIYKVVGTIPPNLINAGNYKFKVIFGENGHVLYAVDDLVGFEIENDAFMGQFVKKPGIIRTEIALEAEYQK